jgi:hypothetical protein
LDILEKTKIQSLEIKLERLLIAKQIEETVFLEEPQKNMITIAVS